MGRQWAIAILSLLAVPVVAGNAPNVVTLEFSVRSMDGSTPIRGAEIVIERLAPPPAGSTQAEDVDDRIITRAESNERGEVRLDELPWVPMRVTVRADGYVSPAVDDLKTTRLRHKFDLVLPRAIDLAGTVLDDTGKPVPNVRVELATVIDKEGRLIRLASPLSATTDASGAFVIKKAPEARGQFAVTTSGYALLPNEAMRPLSPQSVQLVVRRTGFLRVDVDAPLHLRGQYSIKVQRQAESGALTLIQEKPGVDRGSVIFTDLPAGKYVVLAEIETRRGPERPLTATADVSVGQATEVRVTSAK